MFLDKHFFLMLIFYLVTIFNRLINISFLTCFHKKLVLSVSYNFLRSLERCWTNSSFYKCLNSIKNTAYIFF